MSERLAGDLGEQLCCLMDNELEDSQARFLYKRLESDTALRERWQRLHLARSVLQDRRYGDVGDLSARVSAAIADEVPESVSAGRGARRWLQPLAGAAVAASVAVVAFNFWQTGPAPMPAATVDVPVALVDQPVADLVGEVNNATNRIAVPAVASEGRQVLQQYMIRHAQATGSTSGLQFVYVVSGDPVPAPQSDSDEDEPAMEGDGQSAR